MIRFNFKRFQILLALVLILSFSFSNLQDVEELIKPKCVDGTIKYSISANLKDYLENEKNIDGRPIFNSLSDIYKKKVGVLAPFSKYVDKTKFTSVTEYEDSNLSTSQAFRDLISRKIDAIVFHNRYSTGIILPSNSVSLFPEYLENVKIAFALNKNKGDLKEEINSYFKSNSNFFAERMNIWKDLNLEEQYIDKNLSGDKGQINVVYLSNRFPYSYSNSYLNTTTNELNGLDIDFLYSFAREKGYTLKLTQIKSMEEAITALTSGSADIAVGFIIKEEGQSDIIYTDTLYEDKFSLVVRTENHQKSLDWINPKSSIKDFDGENIGIITGGSYNELTKTTFPNSESKLKNVDSIVELFELLLREEITGFLMDGPLVQYYTISFPSKIVYFSLDNQDVAQNAFGFQKKDPNSLLNEFNVFLEKANITEKMKKWNVIDTREITIDKNLDGNKKTIKVGFYPENKPLCFIERNEIKGFEVDLIYEFARTQGYKIESSFINLEERVSLLENGKLDISVGLFTITDDRKKRISFSNPIYPSPILLASRADLKKDLVTIKIEDKEYKEKSENTADVEVNFSNDQKKTSKCVFPKKYNETILINCTLSDLENVNASEGFKYSKTTDRINIQNKDLEINNLLQANTKISGHNNIIKEDETKSIDCQYKKNNHILTILGIILACITLLVIIKSLF